MTRTKHVCFEVKRIPLIVFFSLDIIFVQWLKLMFNIFRSFKMTLHPIFNYIFFLQRHMDPEDMSNRKKDPKFCFNQVVGFDVRIPNM